MTDESLPITLAEAATGFFGGRLKVASLRAEARRGSLRIYRIGRTDFTTVADLKAMLASRAIRRDRDSTSTPSVNRSETELVLTARAATLETVKMLTAPLRRPR